MLKSSSQGNQTDPWVEQGFMAINPNQREALSRSAQWGTWPNCQEGISPQLSFLHFFLVSLELLLCLSLHHLPLAKPLPHAQCGGPATLLPFLGAVTVVTEIWIPQGIGKSILLWWGQKPWDKNHRRNLCSSHFQVSVIKCVSEKMEGQEKWVSKVLLKICGKTTVSLSQRSYRVRKHLLIWLYFFPCKISFNYVYMYKKC